MKHRYLPMTEQDKQEMLDRIGVATIDELFEDIPEKFASKEATILNLQSLKPL